MVTELEPIIQHINLGNYETAERALESFLLHNPKIIDAWMLLGQLSDDPLRKAECFRQVLVIDPGNLRAEKRLEAVEKQIKELASDQPAQPKANGPIRCPHCEAVMEIRLNGSEESEHAFCVYCGTEVDLAESSRQKSRLTLEQRLRGQLAAGEIINDASSNGHANLKVNGSVPPELVELLEILKRDGPDGITRSLLDNLRTAGIDITFNPRAINPEVLSELQNGEYDPSQVTRYTRSLRSVLLGLDEENGRSHTEMLAGLGIVINTHESLTGADLVALDALSSLGNPLSHDESRKCPNPTCGAVVRRETKSCPWCGRELPLT
jgi:hypothetical protein